MDPRTLGLGDGTAYVLFGSHGGLSTSSSRHSDGSAGLRHPWRHFRRLGRGSVSSAGDVNGDGYADLLIGAPYAGGRLTTGAAYVVYGHAGGYQRHRPLEARRHERVSASLGQRPATIAGFPVSAAGDVNGDGFADLIVGRHAARIPTDTDAGSSYVIFGGNFTGAVEHLGTTARRDADG